LVITRNKIPTFWLNKSKSIPNTICLSILYYNTTKKGPRTLQDSNLKTSQYNSVTMQPYYTKHALKLTIPIILKVTPRITILLIVTAGQLSCPPKHHY
jgi:hypothetical protein